MQWPVGMWKARPIRSPGSLEGEPWRTPSICSRSACERAAEALRRLQAENAELKKQLVRAQGALQQAEKAPRGRPRSEGRPQEPAEDQRARPDSRAAALRREREELRTRIARLVEVLDGLDE